MSTPRTRAEMKAWVYRELGAPVIDINISDDQVDDAIDDALAFWQDYHYEASKKIYIAHKITAEDLLTRQIELDRSIQSVTRVFRFTDDASGIGTGDNIFSVDYSLRLNDLWDLSSVNLTGYVVARQYISLLDDLLNVDIQVRFREHEGILHLDVIQQRLFEGSYLMIEAYQKLGYDSYSDGYDPATDPSTSSSTKNTDASRSIWNDRVLRKLCAAYARKRWARNLMLFSGVALPGGVTVNGSEMLQTAEADIEVLEKGFIQAYSSPDEFFMF